MRRACGRSAQVRAAQGAAAFLAWRERFPQRLQRALRQILGPRPDRPSPARRGPACKRGSRRYSRIRNRHRANHPGRNRRTEPDRRRSYRSCRRRWRPGQREHARRHQIGRSRARSATLRQARRPPQSAEHISRAPSLQDVYHHRLCLQIMIGIKRVDSPARCVGARLYWGQCRYKFQLGLTRGTLETIPCLTIRRMCRAS